MKSVLHTRAFETAKHYGTIEFGLHYIKGNPLPYFTVTATGREKGRLGAGSDFGGCCHELILEAAPDMKPLVDLHGSDVNGEPTHAEANGWYWLAGACGGLGEKYHGGNGSPSKSTGECEQTLANHLRLTLNEARGLVVAAIAINDTKGTKETRNWFKHYVASLEDRWEQEADKAIEQFNLGGWAA